MTSPTKLSHEERTAAEPRDADLHVVSPDHIELVNNSIRLIRLAIEDKLRGVHFLPGQWLDVFVPGIAKAGGFTLTSTPSQASPEKGSRDASTPFLELAIQKSPSNPPAAWLWRPEEEVLGQKLKVRVGGSFVWPPPGVDLKAVRTVVLVAGGVGINPLISICAHLREQQVPVAVKLLYSTKKPEPCHSPANVLFFNRLLSLKTPEGSPGPGSMSLQLYVTGDVSEEDKHALLADTIFSRMTDDDVLKTIGGKEEQASTVSYVCGPPAMTDHYVAFLAAQEGMAANRVLCEKWW